MPPKAKKQQRATQPWVRLRPYQDAVLAELAARRFFCLLWRRQGGKSTTLAAAAMAAMMAHRGLTVIYASASLLLGREIISKESQLLASVFRFLAGLKLEVLDARTGRTLPSGPWAGIDPDALADCFESQRLEFRIRFDRTTASRTQVIAPNPATARGWTGWVFLDEFGFIRDFQDLWEAVEPIISTDKSFHLVMSTTPPRDDTHYSYELTAPPPDCKWLPDPNGHWYESEARVPVHRVDIHDAFAAGVRLYDLRSGREVTPEEHFAAAEDKDAWRRNYQVMHVRGGTAACNLMMLDSAQARGIGQCQCFVVDSDSDFDSACEWIADKVGLGPVGLGLDLATTEEQTSNPTALVVSEERGVDTIMRAVIVWKTSDPQVCTERVRRVVDTLAHRKAIAARPRMLCVDATNERYFAADLRRALGRLVPVDLVVGSDSAPPLYGEPINMKQFTGSRLVAALEDNRLWLPPGRYIREDWRLVRKERGMFTCTPDSQGRHGDTFDAGKLSLHALHSPRARPPLIVTSGNLAAVRAWRRDRTAE